MTQNPRPDSPISEFKNRRRWVVATFLLVSGALISLSFYQVLENKQREIDSAHQSLTNYLQISEEAIDAFIEVIDVGLETIADEIRAQPRLIHGYSKKALQAHRDRLSGLSPVQLRLIDANGDVTLTSEELPPSPTKVNFKDREFFQALKEDPKAGLYISKPLKGRIRGIWIVSAVRRISAPYGSLIGLALASIDTAYFDKFRKKIDLGEKMLFAVVTGSPPHFAYRTGDPEKFKGKPFAYHPKMNSVMKGELHRDVQETVSVNDGVHRFTAITKVRNHPVHVVVGKDYNEHMALWRRESRLQIGLLLGVLLLGFAAVAVYLRKTEEILNQQVRLAASSKLVALGEMAASLAHEINNPLTIIKGKVAQLQARAGKTEPPGSGTSTAEQSLLRDLQRVEASTDRIASIVRGLRSYARDGDRDPMSPVSVESLLTDTLELCRERFKNGGIELRQEVAAGLQIDCRPSQLQQIVLNLLNNAYDAVKPLDRPWVEISAKRLGGEAEISIRDCGEGIPTAIVEKMMDPFFTTKEVGKGTGLGLSISQGLIKMHGGSLVYEKRDGHTCFVIRLPARAEENRGSDTAALKHAA